ncbi:unnamed protein product [Parnassius apollo]|uniref:(apollo) hypothetical protein n=1 Tax=Parnassius apollo TaxID=110799 RepID=A0A8S3XR20_PARAO|nr:unnamed protein product [Parnassius apollo]
MDDTQGSRLSDAAATRKRRSSILKSQRPPRTPFSELEFNVATPTDTGKSRRVSFSRRTGVAEFITNEATTTWKNFYEEQNKSIESSGNDSALNPPRQIIGHLGKRIFDQQFQEVVAIDFEGNMPSSNPRVQEMNMSMNVNFTQQIAALESEDERKLIAPQQNFELSSFTDHRSKLFGDEHTIATFGDMSNNININFSAIQPVGSNNDKCDDLDEIQRDLERSQPNVVCQGPFQGRNNSEYIEVDLLMTHIGLKNEDSNMSITDTIHSPKVQEVPKSNISVKNGTNSNVNKDWTLDKENIAINPYVAPKESSNFAINEVPDQVLIFDGRKLTIQPENNDIFNKDNEEQHFRKTLLPSNSSERPTQRKTIILNVNDDLPNFIDDVSLHGQVHGLPISRDVIEQKNSNNNQAKNTITRTVIYDNDEIANISFTQAIPTDILLEKLKKNDEKRQTIVFENDNGNLSMTQLVPTNFDVCTKETTNNKTVVYDGDSISFTQALPSNMLLSENTKHFRQNSTLSTQNNFDMSFTQAVPNNILPSSKFTQTNKSNTILYRDDTGDISMTRVLPTNILMVENQNYNDSADIATEDQSFEKKKSKNTIIYDKDSCNLSMTEAIPKNIIISNINTADKTKTTYYDKDPTTMIDLEKVIKNNCVNQLEDNQSFNKSKFKHNEKHTTNMSMTEVVSENTLIDIKKRKTLNNTRNVCDFSITQALTSNIVISGQEKDCNQEKSAEIKNTIVEDNNDISLTQTVPENIILPNDMLGSNTNEAIRGTESGNILHLNSLGLNISNTERTEPKERKSFENNLIETTHEVMPKDSFMSESYKTNLHMSLTQILHQNDVSLRTNIVSHKRKSIIHGDDLNNISVTQAIPSNIVQHEIEFKSSNATQTENGRNTKVLKNQFTESANMVTEYTQQNQHNISSCKASINPHHNIAVYKDKAHNFTNQDDIVTNNQLYNHSVVSKTKQDILELSEVISEKNEIEFKSGNASQIEDARNTEVLKNEFTESANMVTEYTQQNQHNISSKLYNQSVVSKTKQDILELSEVISEKNGIEFKSGNASQIEDARNTEVLKNEFTESANMLTKYTQQNQHNISSCKASINPHPNISVYKDKAHNFTNQDDIVTNNQLYNQSVVSKTKQDILELSEVISEKNEIEFKSGNASQIEDARNTEVLKNEFTESANMVTEYTQQNQHNISSCKASINPHPNISVYKDKAHNFTNHDDIVTNNQLYNQSVVSKTKQDILELSEVISEENELESDGNNIGNDTIKKSSAPLLKRKEISQESSNAVKSLSYIEQKFETKINRSATEHNHQDLFVYQAVTTHNVSRHQHMEVEQNDSKMDETSDEGIDRRSRISNNPNQSVGNVLNITKPKFTELENKEMSLAMSVNAVSKNDTLQKTEKPRNSILNELLNMSKKSLNESTHGIGDKHLMVKEKSQIDQIPKYCHKTQEIDLELSESIECEENKPKDSLLKENVLKPKNPIYEPEQQNSTQMKSHSEKILSSNAEQENFEENKNYTIDESMNEIQSKQLQNSYRNKTFKTADDTNELLEMLSDFTDRTIAKDTKGDEDRQSSVNVKNNIAQEDRTDSNELKRTSLAKSRMSIMLSREDLLNNISMAHAALQQARIDMDESECIDDTQCETPEEQSDEIMDDANTARKFVRVSTEVVKTLQFDDSVNEIKSKSDINLSPLKKTPFNDTSDLIESKAKVIPSYLSEVSDGIKSLMNDLVKPMADGIPFEMSRVDEVNKNDSSTCSTQIQANIITSSQIDIDIESYPDSECDVAKTQADEGFDNNLKDFNPTAAGLLADSLKSEPFIDDNKQTFIHNLQKQTVPEQVLVFDQTNPLNNVLLLPDGKTNIHKYSPSKSLQLIHDVETNKNLQNTTIGNNVEDEIKSRRISTHYNIITSETDDRKPVLTGSGLQSDDLSHEKVENNSIILMNSKPASADNSTNNLETHIKNTEVNTLITMKGNKELLEASSALTLVDDDEQSIIEIEEDICANNSDLKNEQNLPVKMIFKINDQDIQNFPSNVDLGDAENNTKAKKRIYSPAKRDQVKKVTLLSPEVTPKPLSKMQKLSNSPGRLKDASDRSTTAKISKAEIGNASKHSEKSLNISTTKKQTKSPQKSISSSKPKLEANIIVQHLTVECKINAESKLKETAENMASESNLSSTLKTETVSQKEIKECVSPEMACSFTSSKAMKEIQCVTSVTTTVSEEANHTEVVKELGSKKLVLECESRVNVLPNINKLPFVRSCECEWEYSDLCTWRFRLMRQRLRLTLKLEHIQWNTHTYICAETPVLSATVDVAQEDADALSTTCVRLACEAMRYECGRGALRAGDVCALLRRCAGVARLARRWAAAMHHAYLHLAYKLASDGTFSLHVANIPLRCVWQVTMRLELVIEDARQAAWPRAEHLHVRDVTYGDDVTKGSEFTRVQDLQRVLAGVPHDWGHVPKTIWKVFKYLKNKTKDDELLGI